MIQILKIRKRSNLHYDVKPNIVALGCFNSGGEQSCKYIGTKESLYKTKQFNCHKTGLYINLTVSLFSKPTWNTLYRE